MPTVEVEKGVEIFYEELGAGDKYVLCTQVGHGRFTTGAPFTASITTSTTATTSSSGTWPTF